MDINKELYKLIEKIPEEELYKIWEELGDDTGDSSCLDGYLSIVNKLNN